MREPTQFGLPRSQDARRCDPESVRLSPRDEIVRVPAPRPRMRFRVEPRTVVVINRTDLLQSVR